MGIPPFGPQNYDEIGLCWSTYMGGGGNDHVRNTALDIFDNYYITGETNSSFATFPAVPGTNYSMTGTVAFLEQFNVLNQLKWKTFFGGGEGEFTTGEDVIQRPDGQMYMIGNTDSDQLLTVQPGNEHFQGTAPTPNIWGPSFGYVGRFKILNGQREWATYFGESGLYMRCVASMSDKKLFIGGSTYGPLPPLDDSPPVGSTSWTQGLSADGFVAMLNDEDRLEWETYLPGDDWEEVYDMDAVPTKLLVAGGTASSDMMVISGGVDSYTEGTHGSTESFLYEITPQCMVVWGTYVGGSANDNQSENGISIDPVTDDVILAGITPGNDFEIVPGVGWYQSTVPTNALAGFLVRFSGDEREMIWSTFVSDGGEGSNTHVNAVRFGDDGKIYVVGVVHNVAGEMITPSSGDYYQSAINEDDCVDPANSQLDGIVLRFGTLHELEWATYFGGVAGPFGEDLRNVLKRPAGGDLHIAGTTSKCESNLLSYFPLDDGAGVPYFTSTWGGSSSDVFLAAFCQDAPVGIPNLEDTESGQLMWMPGDDSHGFVIGLPTGVWPYSIFDCTGRVVTHGIAKAEASGAFRIAIPASASGLYLLRVHDTTLRIGVPR